MKPRKPSGRAPGEEGFTLLETLVEVLLLSLALGALAFLTMITFDAWKRSSSQAETRAAERVFLAAVEQTASRISIPFYSDPDWGRMLGSGTLVIPYYRGNPNALLELGSDGHRVWVRSWDADFSLSLEAQWKTLKDDERVVGVALETANHRFPMYFASVPLAAQPRR